MKGFAVYPFSILNLFKFLRGCFNEKEMACFIVVMVDVYGVILGPCKCFYSRTTYDERSSHGCRKFWSPFIGFYLRIWTYANTWRNAGRSIWVKGNDDFWISLVVDFYRIIRSCCIGWYVNRCTSIIWGRRSVRNWFTIEVTW